MNRLTCTDLPLKGLFLIDHHRIGDNRGFLSRMFCMGELAIAGWKKPIAQINYTSTSKIGTVRGMHFQNPPYSEMKLVSCIRGKVWDVALDLREGSPTFLQWHAEILSSKNNKSLLIPEGFAHGFQAMTNNVELLYCHSQEYNEEMEAALNVSDPMLKINWPLEISELSKKDQKNLLIDKKYKGVQV